MNDDYISLPTPGGYVCAPSWDAIAQLHKKISDAYAEVGVVSKDGINTRFNFSYVSYDQCALQLREALHNNNVGFSVSTTDVQELDPIKTQRLCRVFIELTFTDMENGAFRTVAWSCEGADTQDKATSKALTGAVKYALLRNSLLSTVDDNVDPDSDRHAPPRQQNQPPPGKKAPPKQTVATCPKTDEWNDLTKQYFAETAKTFDKALFKAAMSKVMADHNVTALSDIPFQVAQKEVEQAVRDLEKESQENV